jgi:hypothetical protein
MADPTPREPAAGWVFDSRLSGGRFAWRAGPLLAISSVNMMQLPGAPAGATGWTWLVSVSSRGRRAKAHEIRRALRAFGMQLAEEDNHQPGMARMFFMPVDVAFRGVCECKVDEDVIVEADGYRWQNPKEGEGRCRGCTYALATGLRCSIHGASR